MVEDDLISRIKAKNKVNTKKKGFNGVIFGFTHGLNLH